MISEVRFLFRDADGVWSSGRGIGHVIWSKRIRMMWGLTRALVYVMLDRYGSVSGLERERARLCVSQELESPEGFAIFVDGFNA